MASPGAGTLETLLGTQLQGKNVMNVQRWYAIYTRAHHEKRVAAYLTHLGVENFLPVYQAVREWSDRRVRLQLPLFPGYLFAHVALRARLPVLQTPGVVRMVGSAGEPLPLESEQIERLRVGLAQIPAEPYQRIPLGQRVRIIAGPLQGMEGVLLRRKSGLRVVISIELIQRSFVADIESESLLQIENVSVLVS
jgi:transcription antitermination factor NusG